MGQQVFYFDESVKRVCRTHGLSRNAQLQATVNSSCIGAVHDVIGNHQIPIHDRTPWYVWRSAECHCKAAGLLLHIYLKTSSKL